MEIVDTNIFLLCCEKLSFAKKNSKNSKKKVLIDNMLEFAVDNISLFYVKRQKRSTEGCSKFKGPETRQVQERLVSTLEHMQVPKWDRTRCPDGKASSVGMLHLLHMFYGNLDLKSYAADIRHYVRHSKGIKFIPLLVDIFLLS